MDLELAEIEAKITKLAESDFGLKHGVVLMLRDIYEIPVNSFEDLQDRLQTGAAVLRMAPCSVSGPTFGVIATPSESRLSSVLAFLTFVVPVAGLVCSFFLSWWCLLLLLFPVMGYKLGKQVYLRVLFHRAMNSEKAFCFLFCGGLITLELPGHGILYRTV